MTAWAEAARSSPRKLQSRSQMTLPVPKNGSVCSASRRRARAASASPLLDTAASITSWSMPPISALHWWKIVTGALFDGEFVFATNEDDGRNFGRGHFIRFRRPSR